MIVTEIISGSRDALLLEHVLDRDDAGLGVQRVEDRLEQQQVDAAVDQAAHLLLDTRRAARRTSMPRNAGLLTSGEIDSVRLVGPIEPATKRGRSGVLRRPLVGGRARQPRAFDVQLVDERLEPVVAPARWRCC